MSEGMHLSPKGVCVAHRCTCGIVNLWRHTGKRLRPTYCVIAFRNTVSTEESLLPTKTLSVHSDMEMGRHLHTPAVMVIDVL